jgi:hypothetical protein
MTGRLTARRCWPEVDPGRSHDPLRMRQPVGTTLSEPAQSIGDSPAPFFLSRQCFDRWVSERGTPAAPAATFSLSSSVASGSLFRIASSR